MYDQTDTGAICRYHRGTFTNDNCNLLPTWTCCRSAQDNAKGCESVAGHLRCEVTAAALERFPQHATSDGMCRGLEKGEGPDEEQVTPAPRPSAAPDDTVMYTVGVGDSLSVVALRHSMDVATLKKWNKLLSPNLRPGQQLRVKPPAPKSAAQMRADALRRIMKETGATAVEAECLLDDEEEEDGVMVS